MPSPVILPFHGIMPRIHPTARIAAGAVIVGDVEIGAESSVWYGCVLRGDINKIRVGARTNIQDGTIVHVNSEGEGTIIGDDVTIGHQALLHQCVIKNCAFIGMKSGVMDYATVEPHGVLGAGALLTPKKVVLSNQLWIGNPAKYWRDITEAERNEFDSRAGEYVALAKESLSAFCSR
jgi:carbonic anhydrase/acetyltransferase-like protein (isoleucine patch superfamily)